MGRSGARGAGGIDGIPAQTPSSLRWQRMATRKKPAPMNSTPGLPIQVHRQVGDQRTDERARWCRPPR